MTTFERKVKTFCTRNGLSCKWEPLAYNGCRAEIRTTDWYHHRAILEAARRLKSICVRDWHCGLGGVWEGYVYLQDAADAERIDAIIKEEIQRHDNWWQVYHNCIVDGLDPTTAANRAEALYPTPATVR